MFAWYSLPRLVKAEWMPNVHFAGVGCAVAPCVELDSMGLWSDTGPGLHFSDCVYVVGSYYSTLYSVASHCIVWVLTDGIQWTSLLRKRIFKIQGTKLYELARGKSTVKTRCFSFTRGLATQGQQRPGGVWFVMCLKKLEIFFSLWKFKCKIIIKTPFIVTAEIHVFWTLLRVFVQGKNLQ